MRPPRFRASDPVAPGVVQLSGLEQPGQLRLAGPDVARVLQEQPTVAPRGPAPDSAPRPAGTPSGSGHPLGSSPEIRAAPAHPLGAQQDPPPVVAGDLAGARHSIPGRRRGHMALVANVTYQVAVRRHQHLGDDPVVRHRHDIGNLAQLGEFPRRLQAPRALLRRRHPGIRLLECLEEVPERQPKARRRCRRSMPR